MNTTDAFQGDFGLGAMVGRRYSLSTLAGRCSAADAACLREIRDARAYKPRTSEWGEFCSQYLGVSKTQANLLIQLLVEFGPDYFEIAQLIRISPETYRAVAAAIRDGHIHHNGESIPLIAENHIKIAAAIAGLRRAAMGAAKSAPKPALPSPDPILALRQRCAEMVKEFETLSSTAKYRERVAAVLSDFQTRLERIASRI